MSLEPPARIAVLGAGPMGLEAALYARYLGYEVDVFERGNRVAENILRWGHVTLFTPFRMNCTSLGVAAIRAHDPGWNLPAADALLTGEQLHSRYLFPLTETDLLADALHLNTEVLSIGRPNHLKGEAVGDPARGENGFSLLLRDSSKKTVARTADAVIDCTGTYGNPNWLGQGGIPAVGELVGREHIEYGLADILGSQRSRYEGQHTLVIGSGYSAATCIVQLANLAETAAGDSTRITWVTRQPAVDRPDGPMTRLPNDSLDSRDALSKNANLLAKAAASGDAKPGVNHLPGTSVAEIVYHAKTDSFTLELAGDHAGSLEVDRVIANVGFRPDSRIYAELQVHECYASGAPMKLAAHLMAQAAETGGSADCLDQTAGGPASLITPEPNFYILGSKSYGRSPKFLLSLGQEQIRDLFSMIGGREDLDLYATMAPLVNDE